MAHTLAHIPFCEVGPFPRQLLSSPVLPGAYPFYSRSLACATVSLQSASFPWRKPRRIPLHMLNKIYALTRII